MVDLGTLGGSLSEGFAINNYGQVAGSAHTAAGVPTAAFWTPWSPNGTAGFWTSLGFRGACLGINDHGQIVGFCSPAGSDIGRPFLWTPHSRNGTQGTLTWLSSQDGVGSGINERGQVVGRLSDGTGFLWNPDNLRGTAGALIPLRSLVADLGGFTDLTNPRDINDHGDITGFSTAHPGVFSRAFRLRAQRGTLYVSLHGSNANSGKSWTAAKRTVEAALVAAQPGDQVWVAEGTYATHATLPPGVALYGGFGGWETALDHRDWNTHRTILDGEGSGRILTTKGRHSPTQTVDGFVIQNGNEGILALDTDVIIRNNSIINNTSTEVSAGMRIIGGSPQVIDNSVAGNFGRWHAGGMEVGFCDILIEGNTFSNNRTTGNGGGFTTWHANATIRGNTIVGNTCDLEGGGINCNNGTILITGNTIRGNAAGRQAGGIYGGGDLRIIGNTITENRCGENGGGILASPSGALAIQQNTIVGNTAGIGGGGLRAILGGGTAAIDNNDISANAAATYGGGVIEGNAPTLTFNGNTVASNRSDFTGGLAVFGGSMARVEIAGSRFVANTGGVVGGLGLWGVTGDLLNSEVVGNSGPAVVGGLHIDGGVLTLARNVISGNSSGSWSATHSLGCTITLQANRITDNSGGVGCSMFVNSPVELRNNLISGNSNSSGPCVQLSNIPSARLINNTIARNRHAADRGVLHLNSVTGVVANNILAFNSFGIAADANSSLSLQRNCLFGNVAGDYNGLPHGVNDLHADPRFVASTNYRLGRTSPCIDAGDSSLMSDSVDLAEAPRVRNAAVDVGAYEFQAPVGAGPPGGPASQ